MPEFISLVSPEEALQILFDAVHLQVQAISIPTQQSFGRVTVEDIYSQQELPDFKRSTVDGYALLSANTHGASESLPAYLKLIGEVPMGDQPDFSIQGPDCALIHTGGMLPDGADAVVMLEDTQSLDSGEVEIFRPAAHGENVIQIGEDIRKGDVVVPKGIRIRPPEIGGLLALGITEVKVAKAPRFGILSSGDEVIPPDRKPQPGQVRDINSYTLGAFIEDLGGDAIHYGIIPDSRADMQKALDKASRECDHLIVTAGSSASTRDLTAEMMGEMGKPGVLVHGISIKPGKPTIFAVSEKQIMIGLPGNPVSALVIAMVLVGPVIEASLGLTQQRPRAFLPAKLTVNLSSQSGREDWIPVRLIKSDQETYRAEPVFGRSNLIFILSRADGLIKIPSSATGLEAGNLVNVHLM